jgi:amino acid efflux transporter
MRLGKSSTVDRAVATRLALTPKAGRARALTPTIGLAQGVALYTGALVGAGVLILPGVAATMSGPASIVAWGFDALLAVPLALTFARLAGRNPDAGGVAAYAAQAFGSLWGMMAGWFYFVAAATSQALVPLTGAYYAASVLGLGRAPTFGLAAAILLVAAVANLRGLRVSGRLQLVLSGAVVAMLLGATVVSVPAIRLANWTPFAPHGLESIGHTAVFVFFAFFGWEAITHLAEEFRDPARDIPRSTNLTVGLVTAIYLGVAAATIGTATYGTPETDRVAVGELLARPLGLGAGYVAAAMAVVIALGTTNAFVAATSRLGYALARSGSFPSSLATLDALGVPKTSVNVVAVWALTVLGITYVLGWGAENLLVVPNSLVIITYIIGMAAAIRLLRGRDRLPAVIALGACIVLVPFAGVGLAIPGAVAVAAWLFRHWRSRPAGAEQTPGR